MSNQSDLVIEAIRYSHDMANSHETMALAASTHALTHAEAASPDLADLAKIHARMSAMHRAAEVALTNVWRDETEPPDEWRADADEEYARDDEALCNCGECTGEALDPDK